MTHLFQPVSSALVSYCWQSQVLLLSGCGAGVFTIIYTKVPSVCYCVFDLSGNREIYDK